MQDGVRTFDSTAHRKIRYYRAYGDTADSNGHGTHVAGTLAGAPLGVALGAGDAAAYSGMAPDAKLAFIDLADSSSDVIYTPGDLQVRRRVGVGLGWGRVALKGRGPWEVDRRPHAAGAAAIVLYTGQRQQE